MDPRLRELLRIGRCGPVARALSLRAARLPLPGSHLLAFGLLGKPRRGRVVVEVERERLRWALDLRDDAHRLMFLGLYEPGLRRRVLEQLPEGGTLVDVGANVGFWSIPAALRVGPRGRVLAFEPNPWAAEGLRRNVALNGTVPLAPIEVIERAVGHGSGTVSLFSWDLEAGASQATLHREAVLLASPEQVVVPLTSLDEVLSGPVDVLKIDVQGHEAAVLAGAARLFATSPPRLLVVEVQGDLLAHAGSHPEQLVAAIEALGYLAVDGDGTLGRSEVPRPLPADFFETVVFARA